MKTITFLLDPATGEVTYETVGFAGDACRKAVAPFLKAIGAEVRETQATAEASVRPAARTSVDQKVGG